MLAVKSMIAADHAVTIADALDDDDDEDDDVMSYILFEVAAAQPDAASPCHSEEHDA